jgi:prefoldin alpha subunit
MSTENEAAVKEKFMQFQMLQKHIEQINEHVKMLNAQQQELIESKDALTQLKGEEQGSEVLAPIANGVFMKATLKDNNSLLVNVGADTVVEKTVDEVVALLEGQQQQMGQKILEAESFMQQMHEQAYKIYQEVEKSVQ